MSVSHALKTRWLRAITDLQASLRPPKRQHTFFIASAAHDASGWIERHLASIAGQRYPLERVEHVILDDASSDDTAEVARRALRKLPSLRTRVERNESQLGGCANLTRLFRSAPAESIVLQVDADDWLADPGVLAYLNHLYQDPELWMTYNSWQFPDGSPSTNSRPLPRGVTRRSAFREHIWVTSHLHSFRKELFDHVREDSLIDPETGEYFRSAVDMSHYFPMLELAGRRARHVPRILYVYNLHAGSLIASKRDKQLACERRIRALPRYAPLPSLT